MTPSAADTTCPYCGVGCGLRLDARADGVTPLSAHPSNRGRVCVKGNALHETIGLEGRLLHPEIDSERTSWETAIATVASRFTDVIAEHGPQAVAFYGSGQLLTEDYYVANKLMKGFIGSANIDTNSRLCMASAVVAHKRAFGEDIVACDYSDIEDAELVVLVGSNTAWAHPVLYQRLVAARQQHPSRRVVVIDPRDTATCQIADLHLPIAPGSDDWLFVGLLHWLEAADALDSDWCAAHCDNLDAALAVAREHGTLEQVAAATRLAPALLADFYRLFTRTEKALTLFSMGINQSTNGSDKGNAIINCHLATGRIGKPGTGPFSITGQPNAMGGREVGGLANQLAAHRDFDDPEAVAAIANYWGSTRMARAPGLKAVDLFEAVHAGDVKAVWIMATNPAVSMPDSRRVREALVRCDFVAVSDCVRHTDTTALADVLLPALAWGEKDGTVTSAERTVSRQRAFLPAPGEARPDWQIVCEVATAMGFGAAFDYPSAADIFREHARLTTLLNGDGGRALDLGALQSLSDTAYDSLPPTRWPLTADGTSQRPFADGRFYTASGRAQCVAVTPQPMPIATAGGLTLNTGRSRDQWHTMTRSARSARLLQHRDEPFVEVHPSDAKACSVQDGGLVTLRSADSHYVGRAHITDSTPPGQVFAPIHWNRQFARHATVCDLIPPATDPISGQPAFKHATVTLRPFEHTWRACIVSVRRPATPDADYWCRVPQGAVHRLELAGSGRAPSVRALRALSGFPARRNWLHYRDNHTGTLRAALLEGDQLVAIAALTRSGTLPERAHTQRLFDSPVSDSAYLALLAGVPAADQPDVGRLVCACNAVGENAIVQSICQGDATTVDGLGTELNAGTGCGSCRPELQALINTWTPMTQRALP